MNHESELREKTWRKYNRETVGEDEEREEDISKWQVTKTGRLKRMGESEKDITMVRD